MRIKKDVVLFMAARQCERRQRSGGWSSMHSVNHLSQVLGRAVRVYYSGARRRSPWQQEGKFKEDAKDGKQLQRESKNKSLMRKKKCLQCFCHAVKWNLLMDHFMSVRKQVQQINVKSILGCDDAVMDNLKLFKACFFSCSMAPHL